MCLANSSNNTIGGTEAGARNIISGNSTGISILGTLGGPQATGNLVEGNYIGTDSSGLVAVGNGDGILITNSSNNTIGGTSAAERNVISGNFFIAGVVIDGASATGNVIEGNFVGTDASGLISLHNAFDGIELENASGNTIGGTLPGAGNVISGNLIENISIEGGTENIVEGNYIGTDATGLHGLARGMDKIPASGPPVGVFIGYGASDNIIGGTTAEARNVISRTPLDVEISGTASGAQTTGNIVEGNYIGTDATGSASFASAEGVMINEGASDNIIGGTSVGAGNVISGSIPNSFGGVGEITIEGTSSGPQTAGSIVEGNLIGTDATGVAGIANDAVGVLITGGASGNIIGGTEAGARNIISGNTGNGVEIDGTANGPQTSGNVLEGNYIGTDATGLNALGNRVGVDIDDGASNNTVGGTEAGARNIISGNIYEGVEIDGTPSVPQTTGNIVEGNYIGTDATGLVALGNGAGVVINNGATDNVVGGSVDGSGNVISGNGDGVGIGETLRSDPQETGNLVQGNYIGTDATGAVGIPNHNIGVYVGFGATGNIIGGDIPADGNVIAFNDGAGVALDPTAGNDNAIRLNSIFSNKGLGIDLNNDGVTLNHPGGSTSGPNDLENYPVLTSAAGSGAGTTIVGTINSTPNTAMLIDFYSNPVLGPGASVQGKTYLGTVSVTTDASGNASFDVALGVVVPAGVYVTSTATTAAGDTSEFSAPVTATAPPTANGDSYSVNEYATLSVAAPGVLGNDSDPNGLPLSAVLVTGPADGTVMLNADGSFVYVPKAGFFGSDSFTYEGEDGTPYPSQPATVEITVNPVVKIGLNIPSPVDVPGQAVGIDIAATDPTRAGQRAGFAFDVSFGDGTSRMIDAGGRLDLSHVYTSPGSYVVTVTAEDKFGISGGPVTQTVDIVPVAVERDPFDPGKTALFVGGTSGDDTILFSRASDGGVDVMLNGVDLGVFSTDGPIIVFGQGGHDVIRKSHSLDHRVILIERWGRCARE